VVSGAEVVEGGSEWESEEPQEGVTRSTVRAVARRRAVVRGRRRGVVCMA